MSINDDFSKSSETRSFNAPISRFILERSVSYCSVTSARVFFSLSIISRASSGEVSPFSPGLRIALTKDSPTLSDNIPRLVSVLCLSSSSSWIFRSYSEKIVIGFPSTLSLLAIVLSISFSLVSLPMSFSYCSKTAESCLSSFAIISTTLNEDVGVFSCWHLMLTTSFTRSSPIREISTDNLASSSLFLSFRCSISSS